MSFYVDPWLYNCRAARRRTAPEQAAEQDVIIEAMTRALNYAHARASRWSASLGNNHEDIANPRTDISSPDYPVGTDAHRAPSTTRPASTCRSRARTSSASRRSARRSTKSDYSNYATDLTSGEIEVSAPGWLVPGRLRHPDLPDQRNQILSTATRQRAAGGGHWSTRTATSPRPARPLGVIKKCRDDKGTYTCCGYYQYLQGTSMASPHATGVAALAVSAPRGSRDDSGTSAWPRTPPVRILSATAHDHACPTRRCRRYTQEGRS